MWVLTYLNWHVLAFSKENYGRFNLFVLLIVFMGNLILFEIIWGVSQTLSIYFRDGWFFDCNCDRCSDATEFGTFSSAFLDRNGCGSNGIVLPSDPLDLDSPWKCLSCGNSYEWEGDLAVIEEDLTKILVQHLRY